MINTLLKSLLLIAFLIFMNSCSSSKVGIAKLTKTPNEILTKEPLSDFLKSNSNPKIVLRVPENSENIAIGNSYAKEDIYNTIEKEFLNAGFKIQDRRLFEEILEKTASQDYSKINEITETDLIIELVSLKNNVGYPTNKYQSLKQGKNKELPYDITFYGAQANFKIIILKSNEIGGIYEFNHTPCTDGCNFNLETKVGIAKFKNLEFFEVKKDLMLNFMKTTSQELINKLK